MLLVEGKIEMVSYQRLKDTYKEELALLEVQKSDFEITNTDTLSQMEVAFEVMANLRKLWQDLDLEDKGMFLSSIFPKKLLFEKNKCRTIDGSSAISDFLLITNELQADKTKKVANFDDLSCSVASTGIEPVSKV